MGFIPFEEKRNLPTNDLRNFNERNQKLGFQHDKILGELEFKVANIALYYGNQDRLVEHIKEVKKVPFTFYLDIFHSVRSRRNTAGMVLQPQRGRLHAAQTRGSVQSDDPQQ